MEAHLRTAVGIPSLPSWSYSTPRLWQRPRTRVTDVPTPHSPAQRLEKEQGKIWATVHCCRFGSKAGIVNSFGNQWLCRQLIEAHQHIVLQTGAQRPIFPLSNLSMSGRPTGRPWSRFETLISQQPRDRLTGRLLFWIASSLSPRIRPMPTYPRDHHARVTCILKGCRKKYHCYNSATTVPIVFIFGMYIPRGPTALHKSEVVRTPTCAFAAYIP